MGNVYYGKRGELRLYDKTTTPYYLRLRFVNMNFVCPEGANRPDELIKLNRGQLDLDASYIQGLDDPVVDPMTMTVTFLLETGTQELVHEFIGTRYASGQASSWVVGVTQIPLVTTKGTSAGRPAGLPPAALVVLPLFTDPRKVCVNVEMLWTTDAGTMGRRLEEVYFRPGEQSINEAADGVTVNLSGQVYGTIGSITSFTAGNEVLS